MLTWVNSSQLVVQKAEATKDTYYKQIIINIFHSYEKYKINKCKL